MTYRSMIGVVVISLLVSTSFAGGIGPLQTGVRRILSFDGVARETARERTRIYRENRNTLDEDNGEDIVFCLNNGIYVQFADGTGRRLLISRNTSLWNSFWYPTWSPDGTRLAFAGVWASDPREVDLIVVNADGSNLDIILNLDQGYFHSFIQSISWRPTGDWLLFSYALDDWEGNSFFEAYERQVDGNILNDLGGPDISYCQYEPGSGSSRWAYVTAGTPLDMNSRLHVVNYNGSNHQIWQLSQGYIARFRDFCWRNSNTIYLVVNEWGSGYQQGLARVTFPNVGVGVLWTTDGTYYTPTFSPDRSMLYISEVTQSASTLLRCTLNAQGGIAHFEEAGTGYFCNWRQTLPPPVVHLTYPNGGERLEHGQPFTARWTHEGRTLDYYQLAYSSNSGQTWWLYDSGNPIPSDLTSYTVYTANFLPSTHMRMKIIGCFLSEPNVCNDASDADFTLYEPNDVDGGNAALPLTTGLSQNYPNPFNPTTQIAYTLLRAGKVSLTVSNLLGQTVATLLNELQIAGSHTVSFDGSALPSGVYFYRLQTGEFTQTKKMILLK
jgi:hypothetical protein